MRCFRTFAAAFLVSILPCSAGAHDGVALEPPIAVPEAWNVLMSCHANIGMLAAEQRWAEIPIQASLSIQAARFLREQLGIDPAREALRTEIQSVETRALSVFTAAQERRVPEAQSAIEAFGGALRAIERSYEPSVIIAAVFSCPMCRGIRELDPKTPCFKCGMALEPRVIPVSDVYTAPGEPSIALTARLSSPLAVGMETNVVVTLKRKKDGIPVTTNDLRIVHTEPIHLLIVDKSLSDYHHEHPVPTTHPGEFEFAFTPRRSGTYRVFADVVPKASIVQEYAVCDLPADTAGEPLRDRAEISAASSDGLQYELHWLLKGAPGIRVKEPVRAEIRVSDAAGAPFRALEPVMGTYAHIVAFHEDGQTVIHIHPSGGAEPDAPTDRGGPSFKFTFYAPKPGFYRLYSQVQVGGVSRFAPFGLTAAP